MQSTRVDRHTFRDHVLAGVAHAFARRRKAIVHNVGRLFVEAADAESEQLSVRFVASAPRPIVILELLEGNLLTLYLRSSFRAKRGTVLLRLERLRVVNAPERIVETFEWTLAEAWQVDSPEQPDAEALAKIAARWNTLVVRAV